MAFCYFLENIIIQKLTYSNLSPEMQYSINTLQIIVFLAK